MTHWSINMQDGAHFGFEKPERTLEEIIEHERVRAPLFGYMLLCYPSIRVCDAVPRFLFQWRAYKQPPTAQMSAGQQGIQGEPTLLNT